MCIYDIICTMPRWYLLIIVIFSLFYAIRGVMEKQLLLAGKTLSRTQRVMIEYIQEFLFKVIFTVSGFLALFIADRIFAALGSLRDISAGTAVILVFLFIWGVLGVSGYLTFLIIRGKFPASKLFSE